MKSLISVLVLLCIAVSVKAQGKPVVCYYGTWAVYRYGLAQFDISHIDPNICTHIVYAFFGITNEGYIRSLDPYLDLPDDWGRDFVGKFIALRQQNPNVKLLAALGGWNFGSEIFSQVAADAGKRHVFALSAVEWCLKYGFDGIDMDWEYPNQRGGQYYDIQNFNLMLTELKNALRPHGWLVTAAVGATKTHATLSYDIPNMVPHLDLVHLMTYDLHGSWNPYTGLHSAFREGPQDSGEALEWNMVACVEHWLANGCPANKLVVGVPTYGRSFTLANAGAYQVGAPSAGPGQMGDFVGEQGFLPYNELCYTSGTWNHFWANEQACPYAVRGNQWVGYDNADSLNIKIDWMLQRGVGGIMYWSLETDDFGNICGGGRYPLISLGWRRVHG